MTDKEIETPHIDVRVPHVGEWIRVHPSPDYRQEITVVNDNGVYYMIAPDFLPELKERVPETQAKCLMPSMLFTAQNKDGVTFLWPVKSPVPEDHLAYRAMSEWVCFPLQQ